MKRLIMAALAAAVLANVFALSAAAQSPAPEATADALRDAGPGNDIWSANQGDEPVGPDDLIYVAVTGSPELTRSFRVSPEGTITLPMGNAKLTVAGDKTAAIAAKIADSLVQNRILVAPIVSVSVLDYRSRRVSVVGAVHSPTVFAAVGDVKLLDAIARAQGIAPEAGPELIVTRHNASGGAEEAIRIQIKDLLAGRDASLNLPLHGGEEIRVPEAPKLFVVGNVRTPGTYPMTEPGGTTVLKALAMSQGILSFTAKNAYVYREKTGAAREEIAVPLRDILHRRSPDVALLPNDILYIPENTKAHLSATVLDRITNFGGSTASGLIIFR